MNLDDHAMYFLTFDMATKIATVQPALAPQPGPFGAVAAFTSTPRLDLVAAGESASDFQMSTAASAGAGSTGGVSAWRKVFVQICCFQKNAETYSISIQVEEYQKLDDYTRLKQPTN